MGKNTLVTILVIILLTISISITQLTSKGENQFNTTDKKAFLNPFNQFAENVTIGNMADFNITLNISNSSFLENSIGKKINFLVSKLSINVSNNSYENVTVYIDFNTSIYPGRYIGNLSIFNSTNSSINITEFLIVADIPIDVSTVKNFSFTYNYSKLNPLYNSTSNLLDLWETFILNNSIKNISFVTIYLNDSAYALFNKTTPLNWFNLTTSLPNTKRIIYIPYSNGLQYLHLISLNETAIDSPKHYNLTIKLSSLNFTHYSGKCSWFNLIGLNYLVCDVDSNSSLNVIYSINNNLDKNYTNLSLEMDNVRAMIIDKELFFNLTNPSTLNKSFEIYVPDSVKEIHIAINWNNDSSYFDFSLSNVNPYYTKRNNLLKTLEKAFSDFEKNKKYKIEIISNNTDIYSIKVTYFFNFSFVSTNYSQTNFSSFESKNYSLNISLPEKIFGSITYGKFFIFKDDNNSTTFLPVLAYNNQPNFEINNSYCSLDVIKKENIGFNKKVVIPFLIKNRNFTEANNNLTLTNVYNSTSLKFGSNYINYTHDLNLSESINISSDNEYIFNVTLNINSSNPIGTYSDSINISSSNGLICNNFTISLSLNLTNELIVNDTKVLADIINPNSYFNLSTKPFYQNYSFVNGLNNSNFTIKFYRNVFSYTYSFNPTINNVWESLENYTLNISIGNVLGGNFTVEVNVTDGRGNFGLGRAFNISINESLLTLHASPSSTTFSYATNIPVSLTVYNLGNKNESGIAINAYSSGCNIYPSSLTISSINYSSSYSNSSAFTVATQNNSNCSVTINSSHPKFFDQLKESSFTILYQPSSSSQEQQPSPQPQQNQTISYSLNIVEYVPKIYVKRNGENSTIVKVNNPSSASQTVYLEVKELDSKNYEIIPKNQVIDPSKTVSYLVKFNATNLEIKNYSLSFYAYSNYANDTKPFILIVYPNEEDVNVINNSLSEFEKVLKELESNITSLEKAGMNLTFLKNDVNDVKNILNETYKLFENKDYFNAYIKIGLIRQKIDNILSTVKSLYEEKELKKTEEKKKGISFVDIIIIVAIVAAIGFLIYLLLPYEKINNILKK